MADDQKQQVETKSEDNLNMIDVLDDFNQGSSEEPVEQEVQTEDSNVETQPEEKVETTEEDVITTSEYSTSETFDFLQSEDNEEYEQNITNFFNTSEAVFLGACGFLENELFLLYICFCRSIIYFFTSSMERSWS